MQVRIALAASLLLFCGLCGSGGPPATTMPATTMPIMVSAERVFTVLTAHSWTFGIRDRLPDYHIYRFRADGSYVLEHHTDYTTRPLKGRWNLRQDAGECWIACLDDG